MDVSFVIASEAKQSIPPRKQSGLLRRFAPLHKRYAFVAGNDADGVAPTDGVIPAQAGIQYAAAYRFNHKRLWNTGSSGQAGR